MFIIKHMENIIIIGTYPNTTFREDLLRSCIEQMRNLEMDIMLVSHYPIPTDIQASVDYVVYDKNNSMVSSECTPKIVVKSQDFVLTKFDEGHILAVSNNIINGISSAHIHGYNNFIYLEYDNIFHPEDLVKLKNLLLSMRTLNKQMFYFKEEIQSGFEGYDTIIFGGGVKYFVENNQFPKIESDLENQALSLERFVFWKHHKVEQDFYIIPYSSSSYFNKSKINLEFKKYFAEVFQSNRLSEYYFVFFNLIPEPIKLKFQNQNEQELNNNCWTMHRIYEDVEYSYDVTVDGITTNFSFIMTEENKAKFIKNGFLCFLNTY